MQPPQQPRLRHQPRRPPALGKRRNPTPVVLDSDEEEHQAEAERVQWLARSSSQRVQWLEREIERVASRGTPAGPPPATPATPAFRFAGTPPGPPPSTPAVVLDSDEEERPPPQQRQQQQADNSSQPQRERGIETQEEHLSEQARGSSQPQREREVEEMSSRARHVEVLDSDEEEHQAEAAQGQWLARSSSQPQPQRERGIERVASRGTPAGPPPATPALFRAAGSPSGPPPFRFAGTPPATAIDSRRGPGLG